MLSSEDEWDSGITTNSSSELLRDMLVFLTFKGGTFFKGSEPKKASIDRKIKARGSMFHQDAPRAEWTRHGCGQRMDLSSQRVEVGETSWLNKMMGGSQEWAHTDCNLPD